jgi:hypothetical protein
LDTSVVQLNTLFEGASTPDWTLYGCDFSTFTGTLFKNVNGSNAPRLISCKLNASTTVFSTTTLTDGGSAVSVFDSAAGDVHYGFEYHSPLGSLVTQTTVYANAGAQYDGTNRCAWKIDTSANVSFEQPFKTPWVELYWDGTSGIAPYLEILRDGSATAWKDDEVWVEVGYKNTAGSVGAEVVDDRCTISTHRAGTASNQAASALGAADWTGENATAWFGKLQVATITPQEIGMLRARVCVAVNTDTSSLYVDPYIRT